MRPLGKGKKKIVSGAWPFWVSFPLKQKQVCKANKKLGLSDCSHQIKKDLWCVRLPGWSQGSGWEITSQRHTPTSQPRRAPPGWGGTGGPQKAKVPAFSFSGPSCGKPELACEELGEGQSGGVGAGGRGGGRTGWGLYKVSYRISQTLQVWGFQHKSIKYLLGLPPHI